MFCCFYIDLNSEIIYFLNGKKNRQVILNTHMETIWKTEPAKKKLATQFKGGLYNYGKVRWLRITADNVTHGDVHWSLRYIIYMLSIKHKNKVSKKHTWIMLLDLNLLIGFILNNFSYCNYNKL